jgi:hypothetical protein
VHRYNIMVPGRATWALSAMGGQSTMSIKPLYLATLTFAALCASAFAEPVKVVAAENFYGDVAAQR